MKVAVIVLTWNAEQIALECLKTLMSQQWMPDDILVVDNASADNTVGRIREAFPSIRVMRNARNLGFSGGMNRGITLLQAEETPPEIVVLLNQDTLLAPTWLGNLVAPFADEPELGAAGCKMLYHDGRIQHAGAYLEHPRAIARHIGWGEPDQGQYDKPMRCEMVTGAAIALRMESLHRVGLFDTGYTPAYYEDVDLCWRLRQAGYTIRYVPGAVVTHHESFSIRNDVSRLSYYHRGRLRFILKHYPLENILGDFARAEQAYIVERQSETLQVEERPLRWAYLDTIGRLPEILRVRSSVHPPLADDERAELLHILLGLKHAISRSYYRRALETIGSFRTI